MAALFEQWLARRTTLRLLRHLVAPNSSIHCRRDLANQHGRAVRGQRRHRSSDAGGIAYGWDWEVEPQGEARASQAQEGLWRHVKTGKESHAETETSGTSRVRYYDRQMGLEMYGINMLDAGGTAKSWEELRFQMDVNNDKRMGKLLIDQEDRRDNMQLWVNILRFRHRIDGFRGVADVWYGMRKRDLDLPVTGPQANELWTAFLTAGVLEDVEAESGKGLDAPAALRRDVIKYAISLRSRNHVQYDRLYSVYVGRCLRVNPRLGIFAHKRLTDADLAPPRALASLIPDALIDQRASKAFRRLYKRSGERNQYDACMDTVLSRACEGVALNWHRFFINSGDEPTPSMRSRADVQKLLALDTEGARPPLQFYADTSQSGQQPDQASVKILPPTRESMNMIMGDIHGIKPKEISDSFCAKLLATRAFSLDLVIQGLSFFGIHTLGASALRELVVRTKSPAEFKDKTAVLKRLNITIAPSTYSKLTLMLAEQQQIELWTTLMDSDQHAEAFDDAELQERFLQAFLADGDIKKAHLTLVVLSIHGSKSHMRGWNRVFEHYVRRRNYSAIYNTMQSMRNASMPLTLRSISYLFGTILPQRSRGKIPVQLSKSSIFDPLTFCTNAIIHSSEQGQYVPHYMWVELLKRYGLHQRWDDLNRLALWMADWYSVPEHVPRPMHIQWSGRRRRTGDSQVLVREIFTPDMVKAFIAWGFKQATNKDQLKQIAASEDSLGSKDVEPWAVGIALAKTLFEKGYLVNTTDVRQAFTQRMWVLFGPGFSVRKSSNEARRLNQLSLRHYIDHANLVWPNLVDWMPPSVLENTGDHVALLVHFFGKYRVTNHRKTEFADVRAWAKSLQEAGHQRIYEPYTIARKERAWGRSRFRKVLASPEAFGPFRNPATFTPVAEAEEEDEDEVAVSDTSKRHNDVAELLKKHRSQSQQPNASNPTTPFQPLGIAVDDATYLPSPEHRSPSARSENLHPPPSQQYIPEPA